MFNSREQALIDQLGDGQRVRLRGALWVKHVGKLLKAEPASGSLPEIPSPSPIPAIPFADAPRQQWPFSDRESTYTTVTSQRNVEPLFSGLLPGYRTSNPKGDLLSRFLQIPYGDFRGQSQFLQRNNNVDSMSVDEIAFTYGLAIDEGHHDLARRCAERFYLLGLVQNTSHKASSDYLSKLEEEDELTLRSHFIGMENVRKHLFECHSLSAQSGAQSQSPGSHHLQQPDSSDIRQESIEADDWRLSVPQQLPLRGIGDWAIPTKKRQSVLEDHESNSFEQPLSFRYALDHNMPSKSHKIQKPGFFVVGRVFSTLWHENVSGSSKSRFHQGGKIVPRILSRNTSSDSSLFGQSIFTSIRRMVVIRSSRHHCIAIPIYTYSGLGLSKPGLSKTEMQTHAIIHDAQKEAVYMKNEPYLRRNPIAVNMSPSQTLAPASRVRFDKAFTVEHNVEVEDVGRVTPASVLRLRTYFTETLLDSKILSREKHCHQVFKTSSYERHKDINPHRIEGTCDWVLNHPQFEAWRNNNQSSLLWISADPGCGKSVLSKSLVDQDLRNGGDEAICYFFFKDNEEQDNLAVALCALLHQLFAQQPELIRHALPTWEVHGNELQNNNRELCAILQSVMTDRKARPTICVLDALDECRDDDQRQLVELLSIGQVPSTQTFTKCSFKVIVTSRPYDSVPRWFDVKLWSSIRLRSEDENEQIRHEIDLVIETRVKELACEFSLSEKVRMQLQAELLRMQHHTYLWLHLVMEQIRQIYADSLYPDEMDIPVVPSSIEDAYARLLQKITEPQKPAARQVLSIIVGARRPLSIKEMALALGAIRASEDIGKSFRVPNQIHLRHQIRHWFGLFVRIQYNKLYLVHQTAKEFLLTSNRAIPVRPTLWRSIFNLSYTEKVMANICTTYLLSARNDSEDRNRNVEDDEFWEYCAESWTSHAQDDDVFDDPYLLANALSLYNVEGPNFSWFKATWKTSNPLYPVPYLLDQHVIAMKGHTRVLQELLRRQNVDIDVGDSTGKTPLIWAAEAGHLATVTLLLQASADVNAQGGQYGNALQAAVVGGYMEIVQHLLQAGADVNAQGGQYGNALQAAVVGGYMEIVQHLLQAGADVNAQGGRYSNASQAAVERGHVEILQMLVAHGTVMGIQSDPHNDALQTAASKNNEQMPAMTPPRSSLTRQTHCPAPRSF